MYRKSRLGGGSRFFNPKSHQLHSDGLLTIKASGWENSEEHWTGWITLSTTDPDYDFWYWMACVKQVSELVPEFELDKWKSEYATRQEDLTEAVR